MKKINFLGIIIILSLLIGGLSLPAATAQTDSTNEATLVSSDQQGLELEVQTDPARLSMGSVNLQSQTFTDLTYADWATLSQPGAPALPMLTEMFAVPFGAEVELEITAAEKVTLSLEHAPLPSPTQTVERQSFLQGGIAAGLPAVSESYTLDAQIYEAKEVFPAEPAWISSDGQLRQQRIASLVICPFQYDPQANTLAVITSLRVEVRFTGTYSSAQQTQRDSDVYEQLYRSSLLNYEEGRAWRMSGSQSLTAENSLQAAPTQLPWTPPDPGWRVATTEAGLYHLTYNELLAAGVPVASLNPHNLQLFSQGVQVPIRVIGEEDGHFNVNDQVIFYAEKVNSKYTAENIYWLTVGATPGLRMQTKDGMPGSAEIPTTYMQPKSLDENLLYFTYLQGDDNLDRFVWASLFAPSDNSSFSANFQLTNLGSGYGVLRIRAFGSSSFPANPDHRLQVSMNSMLIGDTTWDGLNWKDVTFFVPQAALHSGSNTITFTLPNDLGLEFDWVLIDEAILTFPSTFTATDDQLTFFFSTGGTHKFQVDGFSSEAVAAYDVTDPRNPFLFINTNTQPYGSGKYSLLFEDTVTRLMTYALSEENAYKSVAAIIEDTPVDFEPFLGADYIIITPSEFITEADRLAAYREGQGLRTFVVDVQDIYDVFSYGIVSAASIHDFLAYAYANWPEPAPSYVLLFGNGNYNPKHYEGSTEESLIPPYLAYADPSIGETAADNRYVTLAGVDRMPDMMLGRVTVKTLGDATAFVNKVISYENSPDPSDWDKAVMLVADNADEAGDFPASSNYLADNLVYDNFDVTRVHLGENFDSASEAHAAVVAGFNNGNVLVNYIGHGAYTQWAGPDNTPYSGLVFHINDVYYNLTNGSKLPVVLAMTCYEGYYIYPDHNSLGDFITRTGGKGAIASWSPTGAGIATGHDFLDRGFFRAFFQNGVRTVGEGTIYGKLLLWASGQNFDLMDTFLLFGDPAVRFERPLTAVNDSYTGFQGNDLVVDAENGVLANDYSPDGAELTITVVDQPPNGTLVMNTTTGAFTFTPVPGWNGLTSFTYRLSAGDETSNLATVILNIFRENHVPTDILLSNDTIYENSPINTRIGTLSTVDEDSGEIFTYTLVDGEGSDDNASFNIYQNNLRSSTVFNYEVDNSLSVRIRSTDLFGAWIEKPFTISVLDRNDPPVAADDEFETNRNEPLVIDSSVLLENDYDEDDPPESLFVSEVVDPVEGTVSMESTTITFIPARNFTGEAGFGYLVSDGEDEGYGYVTVNVLDEGYYAPEVGDIPDQTIEKGKQFQVIHLDDYVEDFDTPDGDIVWTAYATGELQVSIVDHIATIIIPDAEWYGRETITFRATDPQGLYDEDAATFTVTITFWLHLPLIMR